jgi:hypothetical protein
MSGLDIFAWIVLIILVASVIAVFCVAGWLPGHIAKTRGHPVGASRDSGRLGHADLRLCALAGRADLGVCRCARAAQIGAAPMMIAIIAVYLVLLFALVRLGIATFNLFWKVSPFIVLLLLNFGLFIPMGWGAPQGDALVVRNAVSIIPSVVGEVVEVPVEGNTALKAGDVLFRIDPVPDTSETIIGVEISQNARYIAPGQPVELTFKLVPGTVYTGKVETALQAISNGQTQTSGLAVTPKGVESAPFVVRVKLDDEDIARRLPAGSAGTAAIFTEAVKVTHLIRKVLLRQLAILNYVNPF